MYKDTTITFPALGVVLAVVLAVVLLGYAVAALDRLSPSREPVEAAAGGTAVAGALAPRTLALREVAIVGDDGVRDPRQTRVITDAKRVSGRTGPRRRPRAPDPLAIVAMLVLVGSRSVVGHAR